MKLNKKGFTLVELLAVIVVLALLMVVGTSSIGAALSNSKKSTLLSEAKKLINQTYQDAQSKYMLGESVTSPVTGSDGDYNYKIVLNSVGNVESICVKYKEELSVTQTYSGVDSVNPQQPVFSATSSDVATSSHCSVSAS